nr:MAG TPA: hypothetical protein [Caudoviricetes sp.]DAH97985.1 MAG TPA: hypothetical protein [Caudoviricetes sp.]
MVRKGRSAWAALLHIRAIISIYKTPDCSGVRPTVLRIG